MPQNYFQCYNCVKGAYSLNHGSMCISCPATGAVCYGTSLSQHNPLANFRDRLLDSGVYAKRGFYGWWYRDQSDRRSASDRQDSNCL